MHTRELPRKKPCAECAAPSRDRAGSSRSTPCPECAASFGDVPVSARELGRGRGEGDDAPRLGVKLEAQAEPEFDEKPECLADFGAYPTTPTFGQVTGSDLWTVEGPFSVSARFAPPCKCKDLEYRQFIRGHIIRDPDGEKEDRGDLLSRLPSGSLSEVFQEDGDTSATPSQYGYRSNPPVDKPNLVDRYVNAKGEPDQANGCRYDGADTPSVRWRPRKPGETYDIKIAFYGEIRRQGRAIKRRHWTAINGRFTPTP
jgi:hypothetical protein